MTSTASYPTPSPTSTLEDFQRMHLRKSSRKLEAMLGVTPIVLQVNIAAANKASVPLPLTTPRTRARRRRAQVCQPAVSPYSSATDDDDATVVNAAFDSSITLSDISSFVWVDGETTPHSGYLPHSLPEAVGPVAPTHRLRSKSEVGAKPYKAKAPPLPGLPASVFLEHPSLAKKGQAAAQPVLVVRPPPGRSPVTPSHFHRKSPSAATFTSINSSSGNLPEPLSPRSPLTPLSNASFVEAQEREMRRKKMAKLARTLGSNVPPELVFQQKQPKERRASTSKPKRKASSSNLAAQRKASSASSAPPPSFPNAASLAVPTKKFQRANRPRSLSVPQPSPGIAQVEVEQVIDNETDPCKTPSPIVFAQTPAIVVEAPSPPPVPPKRTRSKTASSSSKPKPKRQSAKPLETPKYASAKFTGHVASKSVPHLGPFVPAATQTVANHKGSLDSERPAFAPYHAASKSLVDYRTPADYVYGSNVHRRKEREWSGEWNVTDMGDVMKKLRNLKGR
ncbi:hypothetical protein BKA70DRAFT_1256696 [Coprinopsis sp. MPI-PUGE-AT-0042]|nr:hypothetical protein BKA70DRAFT_1256696 [Coprinopsis sp. MPI-PUGE-AT-0042]